MYLLLLLAALVTPPKKPPVAYYCASGWRVKYHTSPTCPGLRYCSARVLPISSAQLRRQRMEPCRWCHNK